MKITDALLTMGAFHGRTGRAIKPEGIVVHYVANPGSSAIGNRNYFENGSNGNGVSSHYIVGLQGEVIRCIPETEVAMHAGAAYSNAYLEQAKKNNSIFYGIETCHPGSDGKFSEVTNQSLLELCADMCIRHKFDPIKNIYTHNEVTGKNCPAYFVKYPEAWKKFKNDVQSLIAKSVLPAGMVNLTVDGINYQIEATNKDGTFYSTLQTLTKVLGPNQSAGIRSVLEANGYSVSWNQDLYRITAAKSTAIEAQIEKENSVDVHICEGCDE
ncbi:MAG: N-acetylmuramoyl-L-alanine amidase [Clostridiales bacterium]|jgi:N-acetylmuramoyl-L-alanine amidase|nr:N-acetylmuramoyl-L-alanine amidase [Clostridiales bacterium]